MLARQLSLLNLLPEFIWHQYSINNTGQHSYACIRFNDHGVMQDHAEQVYSELIPISLQSYESKSFGLTFKFNDSQQLIIEEIQPEGTANMV